MRVLIVSQYFWPENFRINAIVESLVARDIEVEVLTGKPNYPDGTIATGYQVMGYQEEEWNGAIIHRVPLIPRGKKSHIGLISNYLSFIISGCLIGSWILRKKQYDVVFVYGLSPILSAIPALLIGKIKKINVITWIQDLWPESLSATGYIKNKLILKLVEKIVRFIYKRSDLLLIQSHAFDAPVRELASNTPIMYYPNSVDEFFSSSTHDDVEIPSISSLTDSFSVMFAGNIGAAQGIDVIVEAASVLQKNTNIQFIVLGDGSCRKEMMSLAETKGLKNIQFPGRFPVETMPAFMKKASVLLVTLTDQPIFKVTVPNKIQAYLAVGKPIIACLNGEGARVVEEAGAGVSTTAEDAQKLAEAVTLMYEKSEEELTKFGNNGRLYYEKHFNHENLVEQLINILKSQLIKEEVIS
jgi:glycosyltransferase involved in cell wall biosynthesis